MRILLLIALVLPIYSISQNITHFDWESKAIEISSVEMEVSDQATKKPIFKGYKDALIKIETGLYKASPKEHTISMKLSGYFELTDGYVRDFKYEMEKDGVSVSYGIAEGSKYAYIILTIESGKISRVIVSCTPDLYAKTMKRLTFVLTGLDIKEINR
jgi:hypothetical protein